VVGQALETLQFLSAMLSTVSVITAVLMMLAMAADGRNSGWQPKDDLNPRGVDSGRRHPE
jgi:hypothetical protein